MPKGVKFSDQNDSGAANPMMSDEVIRSRAKDLTWYAPVSFGGGIDIIENHINMRAGYHNAGIEKWRYIIQRNLPDLQGRRVIDIGCNAGLFCVEMARMGAVDVVGLDSERTWPRFVEQATFVKEALEWRCKTKYPITFVDAEMDRLPELNLGRFDVAIILCCIYYLKDEAILALLQHLRENCDYVLIQCNVRRQDQVPEVHRRAQPEYIAEKLKKVGFPHIYFDMPWFYSRPVVVGSANHVRKGPGKLLSREGIRYWIRSKV